MKKQSGLKDSSREKGHSQKDSDGHHLYIANISTSAGEIEAFTQLLKHLPVIFFSTRRCMKRRMLLSRIKNYIQLKNPSEVDFSSIKHRLKRRMLLSRIKTIKIHIQYIKENPSEQDNLCRNFLINGTIKGQQKVI